MNPSEIDPWFLRVSDLKQYDYCPRVVYYEYCLPGVRPLTYKMEAGVAAQEEVEALEERRSLRAYGLHEGERHFNVTIASTLLGWSGQIDMVIDTSEGGKRRLLPVDFKFSRQEPGHHFKVQLAAYALLIEEKWQHPVEQGFIYLIPLRRAVSVPLTTRLRNDTRRHLVEIRTLVQTQRVPPPTTQRGRCVNCEFRRFCNDVL